MALKFLVLPDPELAADLASEARRISELSHDNIVGFVDSGTTGSGATFIAMEFVRGLDLDGLSRLHGVDQPHVLRGEGVFRIPCSIVGFILFMVCRALHHAHTRRFSSGEVGLVHRDISPGNILVEKENGFVKLSDFGVAATVSAAQGEGGFCGKIAYAAPEVLLGEPVDFRADVYSLGLVAYELMTGFNPNRPLDPAANPMAQLSHALVNLDEPLVPPCDIVHGASADLSRIVARMLEHEPDRRYTGVDELMRDVRGFLYSGGIGPTTDSVRDYLRILEDPSVAVDDLMRSGLVFLCEKGVRDPMVRRPWKLTDHARARLARGENPARGG